MKSVSIACLLATALGGCTMAEWDSINRQFNPSMGDSRLIDAKQRAIIAVVDMDAEGRPVEGTRRVCAEPSPDALQATATALAGEADGEQLGLLLRGSLGASGSATNIGLRTQSIQLLRDAYYRLCEGSLNGQVDRLSLQTLQKRFQNHMIALLAVEQLTGAAVVAGGTVGGATSANAGANLSLLGEQLTAARTRLRDETAEQNRLNADLAAAEQAVAATTEGTPERTEAEAKRDQIAGSAKGQAEIVADAQRQVSALDTAYTQAAQATINAATTSTATSATARAGRDSLPAHVSQAVAGITVAALNHDDSPELCLEFARAAVTDKELSERLLAKPALWRTLANRNGGSYLLDACRGILEAHKGNMEQRQNVVAAKLEAVKEIAKAMNRRGLKGPDALNLIRAIDAALPTYQDAIYLPKAAPVACPAGKTYNAATGTCA